MDTKREGWILTDPDCLQCCREAPECGERVYELLQAESITSLVNQNPLFFVFHGHVYLNDYTQDEEQKMLDEYGCNRSDLPNEAYDRLLAEMFFETEILEFQRERCTSWNQACDKIQGLTGLDLSDYRTKKAPLENQIRSAGKKAGSLKKTGPEAPAPQR